MFDPSVQERLSLGLPIRFSFLPLLVRSFLKSCSITNIAISNLVSSHDHGFGGLQKCLVIDIKFHTLNVLYSLSVFGLLSMISACFYWFKVIELYSTILFLCKPFEWF